MTGPCGVTVLVPAEIVVSWGEAGGSVVECSSPESGSSTV